MKPMNIFDLHCDTLMAVYIDGYTLRNWTGHINLEKLQKGGSMVQCFAIYIPTNRSAEYHNVHEGPYEYWKGCVDAFDKEMAANADVIRQVRRCKNCGEVSPNTSRYCGACGAKFEEEQPPIVAAEAPAQEESSAEQVVEAEDGVEITWPQAEEPAQNEQPGEEQ